MNHLRSQWRTTLLTREGIAARNGIRVRVKFVGPPPGQQGSWGETSWEGTVLDGTGYRAFGTWKELRDSIASGRYRSKGTFTIEGEGETQFASSFENVLMWSAPGSGPRGTVGIIEADLSGCRFKTFIRDVSYDPGAGGGHKFIDQKRYPGERGGYLWLPREGATEGIIYPDVGLGIGIDGGVPLNQIRTVYEVEHDKITKSWPFREWERHIDSVSDYASGWVAEVRDDPLTHRTWVSWVWAFVEGVKRWEVFPLGRPVFHDCPNGREVGVCGARMGDILNDAREVLYGEDWWKDPKHHNSTIAHHRAMEGHIKASANTGILLYEHGKDLKQVKAKPCPKCWPRYR